MLRFHLNSTALPLAGRALAEGYKALNATTVPTDGFAQLGSI